MAPILWCDNLEALSLVANPIFHTRTKHIKVDYHIIQEKVPNKYISLRFISTQAQIADLFTKGLTKARFLLLRDKLLIHELSINFQGDVKLLYDSTTAESTKREHNSNPKPTLQLISNLNAS